MRVGALWLLVALCCASLSSSATATTTPPPPNSLRPQCPNILKWVPGLLKKPLTVLLNNGYCPSWGSRNFFSKQRQPAHITHLTLPKGIPFAVLCGHCHRASSAAATSLTITHAPGYGQEQVLPQVPIMNGQGEVVHRENTRGHKCWLQYAITGKTFVVCSN